VVCNAHSRPLLPDMAQRVFGPFKRIVSHFAFKEWLPILLELHPFAIKALYVHVWLHIWSSVPVGVVCHTIVIEFGLAELGSDSPNHVEAWLCALVTTATVGDRMHSDCNIPFLHQTLCRLHDDNIMILIAFLKPNLTAQ
jgi:hypothetical protein